MEHGFYVGPIFAENSGGFSFSTLDNFPAIFGTLGRSFLELSQPQSFVWWAWRCSAPGLCRKRRGKGPGFDSSQGAPVQHILLDIDEDEDEDDEHEEHEEHEEDHKDDEGDDDEENKDEFEDDKG